MLPTALFLAVTILSCHANTASNDAIADEIYTNVILGEYQNAAAQARDLENSGRGSVISQAVDKLLNGGQRNVMDYAEHLWKNDIEIIEKYFPFQIRSIFGGSTVELIGFRDNMALKLGANVDGDGDRTAYGDSNHMIGGRMEWRINPISDSRNQRLYFYIYNIKNNQYLKLSTSIDGDGDHSAYGGSRSSGYRAQWFLIPVKHNGSLLFYIFNREYIQALKMSRSVDSYGDRKVYSEAGNVIGSPEAFGWIITPL